jgi:hypothetical protein
MTTRPIRRTTRTMPLNSPRITPGNSRDRLNHTNTNTNPTPLPSTYRTTTPFNPTTTLLMVLPLTPFRIQRRSSGMARRGLRSVSPCPHRHPFKRHPCLPTSADRNLPPYLHLRLHQHRHRHPRPSAYMRLPPSHSPTRRRGEPQGHPRPPIRLPNPSASRGRKKLPFLGIPHRWRRQLR